MEQQDQLPSPTDPAGAPAAPTPDSTGLRTFRTWMRDLFFSVLVAFFIIVFVYQPVKVEGSSMEPGLEDQERIFINKLVYRFESIERGDTRALSRESSACPATAFTYRMATSM
jgi:signal peptidase I